MNISTLGKLHDSQGVLHFFGEHLQKNPQLICSASDVSGRFVLARLANYLYARESEEAESPVLSGFVLAPSVDALPLLRRRRLQKLQHHSHYCVHLGSSDAGLEQLPQVVLGDASDDERATACLFGLPAVVETGRSPADSSFTMGDSWYGEQFRVAIGQTGQINVAHCGLVFNALLAFLTRSGMVSEACDASDKDDELHYFGPSQRLAVETDTAGLFVSNLQVGAWLVCGQHIGCIYDVNSGVELSEVLAPEGGYLLGLRRDPNVVAGSLLAEVGLSDRR